MTRPDITDDEFDAFLKGQDDLSRRLRAMPQDGPSARLDEAILIQARRPEAANDPDPRAGNAAAHFSLRWRIPAGIAATVLAGVLANQAWRSDIEARREAYAPTGIAPARAPEADREVIAPPAPPRPQLEQSSAPPAPPAAAATPAGHTGAQRRAGPVQREAGHGMRSEMAPTEPPTAPLELAAPAPPPPAPEARRAAGAGRVVTVTGSRSQAMAPHPAAEQWEDLIGKLLDAGLNRDALDEWVKFRAAYPDYSIPDTLRGRIDAARAALPRPH